jgi:hypothetical protein
MATLTKSRAHPRHDDSVVAIEPAARRSPATQGPNQTDTLLKRCARCGAVYPMTPEFWYLNRSARDGLHSYCRACRREYQSMYWTLNYSEDGRERRKNMLKPVDYVVLHSEEGGKLAVIYSGGGLAVGRIHAVVEGDLPPEYAGLKKLYEVVTTETNFQRMLAYNNGGAADGEE